MSTSVNVRVPDELAGEVVRRQRLMSESESVGVGLKADAATLHNLLAIEVARSVWTLEEIAVLAQAQGGVTPDRVIASSLGLCASAVLGVTSTTTPLVAKLRELGPTEDHALLLAVAQWWDERLPHSAEGWLEVGVRVK